MSDATSRKSYRFIWFALALGPALPFLLTMLGMTVYFPTPAPTPLPTITPTLTLEPSLILSIVYDNNVYDPRLETAWGFACLVEMGETVILFDTGGDGAVLLSNMAALGLDPQTIDIVVLSHIHGDHVGGLASILANADRPTVYVPRSFPADFKARVEAQARLEEVSGPATIMEGVHTTGEMGSGIIEQALVLSTTRGLVVITGCAHPGIVDIVRQAKEVGDDEVYLVLGGFHLGGASKAKIEAIIADFQQLGVQKVAPCHCTGEKAMNLFREAYGEDFIWNGVGKILKVEP